MAKQQPPWQGMRYYSCCLGCQKRSPACSDSCISYLMAKAEKWAEREALKQANKKRTINGK